MRNYRVVASLVEQAVTRLLRSSPVIGADYVLYKSAVRQLLGSLWRQAKTEQGRGVLLTTRSGTKPGQAPELVRVGTRPRAGRGTRSEIPERISVMSPSGHVPFSTWCERWSGQGLDPELLVRIQGQVIASVQDLLSEHPELFTG
jgi:hypothetical protein